MWRTRAAAGARSLALLSTGLAIAVAVPVALAADGTSRADRLRAEGIALGAAADAAALELYSLESEVVRARQRAAAVAEQRRELLRRQAATRRHVALAARATDATRQRLEELLRELYAHGSVDPLAVVLSASSLDEALAALESLDRAAADNLRLAKRAAASRDRLAALEAELRARGARLAALSAQAEARARTLERRAAERAAFLAELRLRADLTARELAAVRAQASAAQRRTAPAQPRLTQVAAEAGVDAASAEGPAPATSAEAPAPLPAALPTVEPGQTMQVDAVGYSLPGFTASGLPVGHGVVAVDPSVIPLGTRMHVPGYGDAVAADTGSGVRGALIDLWFPTVAQARAWGRRPVVITIR